MDHEAAGFIFDCHRWHLLAEHSLRIIRVKVYGYNALTSMKENHGINNFVRRF